LVVGTGVGCGEGEVVDIEVGIIELGTGDGAVVGSALGDRVSKLVGLAEEIELGPTDGHVLGDVNGTADGAALEINDGIPVGFADEIAVGDSEGSVVGINDGNTDGTRVGPVVGT
jgi:hypothetical protein